MTSPARSPIERAVFYLRVERQPLILLEWMLPIGLVTQGLSWMGGNNPFASSANYDIMARMMPELAWGLLYLSVGLMTFVLQIPRHTNMRRIALIINAVIYLFVGSSFFVSVPLVALAWPVIVQGLIALVVFIEIR